MFRVNQIVKVKRCQSESQVRVNFQLYKIFRVQLFSSSRSFKSELKASLAVPAERADSARECTHIGGVGSGRATDLGRQGGSTAISLAALHFYQDRRMG